MTPPFRDLLLHAEPLPGSDRLRVTLSCDRTGTEWPAATGPPLDRGRLEAEYLAPLRAFIRQPVSPELPEALGRELAAALLPGPIRERLLAELAAGPPGPT